QVEVARAHVRPGMHHRDQRPRDRLVVEAGGAQHGAGGCAVGAALDQVTAHQKSPKGKVPSPLWGEGAPKGRMRGGCSSRRRPKRKKKAPPACEGGGGTERGSAPSRRARTVRRR